MVHVLHRRWEVNGPLLVRIQSCCAVLRLNTEEGGYMSSRSVNERSFGRCLRERGSQRSFFHSISVRSVFFCQESLPFVGRLLL